jgi:hypothetical protein
LFDFMVENAPAIRSLPRGEIGRPRTSRRRAKADAN